MTGVSRALSAALMLIGSLIAAQAGAETRTVMMVTWIGCEDVCRGVQDYFAEKRPTAEVIVRDAAEDPENIAGFVAEARALPVDLVITWGTKVTLGVVGTLDQTGDPRFLSGIPVVFTVVADAVGTRVIESYESTGRPNVTGTRNRVPEAVNIKTLQRYMPEFQHLGVLYDPGAENSVAKVDELRALSEGMGFSLTALPLDLGADGAALVDSIAPKIAEMKRQGVQFIYLGSSAFLEKQSDVFTGAAVAAGLPVLTPYEHMVTDLRALMSVAARDYDVGRLAARQAERVLFEGEAPADLPVLAMEEFAYLVNMRVAKELGHYPPVDFLQFVEQVR